MAKQSKNKDVIPFSNPPQRREIRADFPKITAYLFKDALDLALKKYGVSLSTLKRITIAYPQKDPDLYPDHRNRGYEEACRIADQIKSAHPHITCVLAEPLCEKLRLKRSQTQDSLHALLQRQEYSLKSVKKKFRKPSFHFAEPRSGKKELFIVTDHFTEQGTTLAELVSCIEHNGGLVALAVSHNSGEDFAQAEPENKKLVAPLGAPFNNASRNTAMLPYMAAAFALSAKKNGRDWKPQTCIEKFEKALNAAGHSVFALTHGECVRLVDTAMENYHDKISFPDILTRIANTPAP